MSGQLPTVSVSVPLLLCLLVMPLLLLLPLPCALPQGTRRSVIPDLVFDEWLVVPTRARALNSCEDPSAEPPLSLRGA